MVDTLAGAGGGRRGGASPMSTLPSTLSSMQVLQAMVTRFLNIYTSLLLGPSGQGHALPQDVPPGLCQLHGRLGPGRAHRGVNLCGVAWDQLHGQPSRCLPP